jgi:cardiolipin synthase
LNVEPSDKILTLPNLISVIRLLLVPVFFTLLVVYEDNNLAALVFIIAACTDFLDGMVARSTNSVSKLGQKLDPAIDRVLILSAVVAIFITNRVVLWVLVILIVRDICMALVTLYLKWAKNLPFTVIFVGKCTAACEMVAFASLILWWPLVPGVGVVESSLLPGLGFEATALGTWLAYLSVALSVISGIAYVIRAVLIQPAQTAFLEQCEPLDLNEAQQ